MFYSQWLLSKKGPLGTIWVAAHCHKRLKKDQVKQTNIPSSVDKILLDEVPAVTYRILGYLLLGVVRIYSKKVEYLFHDCRDVLNKISDFVISKKATADMQAVCAPYLSITLPESFELDAFNLEILEDVNRRNVKPREEIMLEETWKNEEIGLHSFGKYFYEEDAAHFEGCSTGGYTPVKDVCSPYVVDNDSPPAHNLSNMEASIEKLRGNRFSLEECLDPMMIGEEPDLVSPAHNLSNMEASIEKLCGNRFSLEECLDPMMLGEEPDLVRPFDEEHQIDGEQIKFPDMNFGEEQPPDLVSSFDEEQHADAKQIKFPEMTPPESGKCQIIKDNRSVTITVDVTPESKFPDASGATTPEFMAVRTPATKERARVSKKRKCLLDDIIVFPNKVLKQRINDSSDLVCKRRKVPHTALHAWKAHQISNLPQSFLEPLIPCISMDLRDLICKVKLKTQDPTETVEIPANVDLIGSPTIYRSPERTEIAPSTPLTHSTSLRFHEVCESTEKELSSSEDQELGISLMNEEINYCEGESQEKYKWSVRTSKVAMYLLRNFLNRKKRKEDEVVNMSRVLNGKTKKESARLFYEILVLKTRGCVDVKQDNAYDDILVLETPNLKQSCETAGVELGSEAGVFICI